MVKNNEKFTNECNSKDIDKTNPEPNSDDECVVLDYDNIMRQGKKKCFQFRNKTNTILSCKKKTIGNNTIYYNYTDSNGDPYLYRRYIGNDKYEYYNTVNKYDKAKDTDIASCKEYSNCLSECTTTSGTTTSSIEECKSKCKTSLNEKGRGIDMCSPSGNNVIEFNSLISEKNKKRMPFVIDINSKNYKRKSKKKYIDKDKNLLFLFASDKIDFIKDETDKCLNRKTSSSINDNDNYCNTEYFIRNVEIQNIKNKINIPTILCIVYVCISLIQILLIILLKKNDNIFKFYNIIILFAIHIKISHHIDKIYNSSKVKEYSNTIDNINNNIDNNGILVKEDYNNRKVPEWWTGPENTILKWINGEEYIKKESSILEEPYILPYVFMICGWIFFILYIISTIIVMIGPDNKNNEFNRYVNNIIWDRDIEQPNGIIIFFNLLHLIFFTVCYWKAYNLLKVKNDELLYLDNEHYNLGIYTKIFRIIYLIYTILYSIGIVPIVIKIRSSDNRIIYEDKGVNDDEWLEQFN
jgi:hypothetical protein